jgi:hypothetical protein
MRLNRDYLRGKPGKLLAAFFMKFQRLFKSHLKAGSMEVL